MLTICHITSVTHNTLWVTIQTCIFLTLNCICCLYVYVAFPEELVAREHSDPEGFPEVLNHQARELCCLFTFSILLLIALPPPTQINKQREQRPSIKSKPERGLSVIHLYTPSPMAQHILSKQQRLDEYLLNWTELVRIIITTLQQDMSVSKSSLRNQGDAMFRSMIYESIRTKSIDKEGNLRKQLLL